MIKALEDKALEMYVGLTSWLEDALRNERGQTSGEYVAVTAVGVVIAIGILYTVLRGAINTAVSDIANKLTTFVSTAS